MNEWKIQTQESFKNVNTYQIFGICYGVCCSDAVNFCSEENIYHFAGCCYENKTRNDDRASSGSSGKLLFFLFYCFIYINPSVVCMRFNLYLIDFHTSKIACIRPQHFDFPQ